MKTIRLLAALAFTTIAGFAQALDIAPWTAADFAQQQTAGKAVALHFHADWCPTCRAQQKVFDGWRGDAAVPGRLLVVDYDNARELRRQLGVRMQSTLIVFKGDKEVARLAGDTDPAKLRAALEAAR
ncbi:thioredoxin family protein [uncultured Azonexus sp.]|uniref:thioredoxin family protein n=1 Tax=uncultured Azonexus sp. TaxID=520307 RepID=UPI0026058E24|nr:thioredoxin family protein [uncultured Azonexus sp.]